MSIHTPLLHETSPAARGRTEQAQRTAQARTEKASGGNTGLFDEDGFSFGDILDAVNPLQHIPIVSSVYRSLTGDDIGSAARMAGGAVFGGPLGLAFNATETAVKTFTGRDFGEHAAALFSGDPTESSPTRLASRESDRLARTSQARPHAPPRNGPPPAPGAAPSAAVMAQELGAASSGAQPPSTDSKPKRRFMPISRGESSYMDLSRGSEEGRMMPLNREENGENSGHDLSFYKEKADLPGGRQFRAAPARPQESDFAALQRDAKSALKSVPTDRNVARTMMTALDKYEKMKSGEEEEKENREREAPVRF